MKPAVLPLVPGSIHLAGMWCDVCLASSVIGYGAYLLSPEGVTLVASITGCTACYEKGMA